MKAIEFMKKNKMADDNIIFNIPAISHYLEHWKNKEISIDSEKEFKDLIRMIYFVSIDNFSKLYDESTTTP